MYISSAIIYLFVWTSSAYCSCPDGWLHHDSSCYHFSHDTEAMPLASVVCQHMGGDLVEIETAEESNYLSAKAKALNSKYVFKTYVKGRKELAQLEPNFLIGLNDIRDENIWFWYGSRKPLAADSFANWSHGQPNNGGNDENCVVITPQSGQWHDVPCHNPYRYICEKSEESNVIVG